MTELAARRAPWGSVLSVAEFAAVRSVGFEPVGQAFGAAVYPLSATAAVSCPGTATPSRAAGASARVAGWAGPAARLAQALCDGYRTAIDRMAGECSDLGGHGIVGASLQVTETPGDSFTAATVEFKVIGTAVRGRGCPRLARPFTAGLSGPDFAKLLMDGWVPAGIALGISVAGLHDTLVTTSSGPWGTGNAEVPAYTDLIGCARHDARSRLEETVRGLGAEGVVVSSMTLDVRSGECHAHRIGADHFAQAVITGTAVARFAGRRAAARAPSLAVLPLDAGGARLRRRAYRDRLEELQPVPQRVAGEEPAVTRESRIPLDRDTPLGEPGRQRVDVRHERARVGLPRSRGTSAGVNLEVELQVAAAELAALRGLDLGHAQDAAIELADRGLGAGRDLQGNMVHT